jgi:pyruvate formate-lyase activating enzyme-like uncharacterized protein
MSFRLYYDEDQETKLNQLLTVSNPREVIIKAIEYFKNPDIKVHLSNRKNKKYMVLNPKINKMVHFGDIRYEDYTKHKDLERKDAYLARASKIKGNWIFDRYSSNNLAIHLLW